MANRPIPLLIRPLAVAGSLLLLLGLARPGIASGEATIEVLRTRIEQAYSDGNPAVIEAARRDLLSLSTAPGRNREEQQNAVYFAAYARFRQALAVESDHRSARRYLDDCIAELREAIRRQPADAQAHALLGSCLGISTLHDPVATLTRGLEARREIREARRLAPDDPWVILQDGLADWATPRLFGGDRAQALTKLERAASLFASAMADGSPFPAWGAAEAYRQLGLRYRELGRTDDARAAFDRAAELTSGHVQLAAAYR